MALFKTLGGDRIGSGQKQGVELHNYMMNSFNLEQDFKSSMAPGILYPFIKLVGTNHGTFDIDLDTFVRTLPTQGPLFGSFKLQLDLYAVPFRLYQGILHNNTVELGLNMNQVYLPKLKITTVDHKDTPTVKGSNFYNKQINESALLKYLGLSGIGSNWKQQTTGENQEIWRKINAIPMLAYYDIFKNYYSNKQEENAYVITPGNIRNAQPTNYHLYVQNEDGTWTEEYQGLYLQGTIARTYTLKITVENCENIEEQCELYIKAKPSDNETYDYISSLKNNDYLNIVEGDNKNYIIFTINYVQVQNIAHYAGQSTDSDIIIKINSFDDNENASTTADIALTPFNLKNIDRMRSALLKFNELGEEFIVGKDWDETSGEDGTGLPYSALFKQTDEGITWNAFTQNGLLVKTYQSDLFNNWLDNEFIETINEISSVDTSSGSFTMDSLNLAEKFYELLNRILVAGGTYQDWQEAVYGEGAVRMCETPMYIGGMAAEIMFEEVIATTENGQADQALGSLGGKGTQVNRKGGNNIHVKMDEPGYVIGIVSITPRICYSQGNDWDLTELDTLDDLHKPALDGIGFQPLMVEQMAWWNTILRNDGTIGSRSQAGKQTAWINYQTAVDKCFGDFAKQDGYAFMVLNRNYEKGDNGINDVKDITTYIDPRKYNYAFAYTELDAQNFWVQIHSKVVARRKMGAQQLPNL